MPKTSSELLVANYVKGRILIENNDGSRALFNEGSYGALTENKKLQLSLLEGLYLLEKKRIEIFDGRKKKMDYDSFLRRAQRQEANYWVRYAVYKDMRNRGYVLKTALKFGADFRVYDRGIKPGEDHAKWVLYPVHETNSLTWYEFAAKNRVAHSTRKRLLLGVVDDEGDCTYYEIKWVRP